MYLRVISVFFTQNLPVFTDNIQIHVDYVLCVMLFLILISVSAFYFECPEKQISMNASIYTKSRFYGMSIGVNLIGKGNQYIYAVFLICYVCFH